MLIYFSRLKDAIKTRTNGCGKLGNTENNGISAGLKHFPETISSVFISLYFIGLWCCRHPSYFRPYYKMKVVYSDRIISKKMLAIHGSITHCV